MLETARCPWLSLLNRCPLEIRRTLNKMCGGSPTSDFARPKFDVWAILILVLATIYHYNYLRHTSYTERTADGAAHLQYVMLILEHHALPEAGMCPMCHHPPFYYIVAAIAVRFVGLMAAVDVPRVLQYLALVFSTGYLYLAALTIQRFVVGTTTRRLGLMLVAFWPTTVMASSRLHCDSLVNLLVLSAFYFTLTWRAERRPRDLAIAVVLAGMSTLTKASGLSAVALLVAVVAAHLAGSHFSLKVVRNSMPAIGALVFVLGLAFVLKTPTRDFGTCHQIAGRWCQFPTKTLPNTLSAYIHFDFGEFLRNPYLIAGGDGIESGLFWNCLLKSSILGIYQGLPAKNAAFLGNQQLAKVLNYLFLAVSSFAFASLFTVGREWYKRYWPLLAAVMISVGFVLAFRVAIPNPYHSDFRHCQPALVCCVVVLMTCIDAWHSRLRWGRYVGLTISGLALCGSVGYYMPSWS